MSAARRGEIWMRLVAAGLVEGDEPPARAAGSPWFVRVMLGIAGWIGALFLLAFGGVLFSALFERAPLALLAGSILCAGAAFLFRWRGDNDFLAQFGFALSLAGQGLLLVGLTQLFEPRTAVIACAAAAIQAVLFLLVPDFLHRVWTSGTGALALVVALASWNLSFLAPGLLTAAFAWVWLREMEEPSHHEIWRAGGYGLTLACTATLFLLGILTEIGLLDGARQEVAPALLVLRPYLGAAVSGGALVWIVLRLLARESVPLTSGLARIALAAALLLGLASFAAPGLAPAVAILVLGQANGNRVLAGLGALVLLGYLSYYYYSLETTLLFKSLLLAGVGSVLLLARLALHYGWPAPAEEGGHA
jgi:Domain of unknown function (DUF4401)